MHGRSALLPGKWRFALLLLGAVAFSAPALSQGVTCLPISKVQIEGVKSLSPADVARAVAPYEGKCLGLTEFNDALQAVTDLYIQAGLITSRVYLPEQDLSSGALRLAAVEGRIEAVEFNNRTDRRWERFTFPGIRNKPANLREIEQGLDNIRAMPSYQGVEMALDAGVKPGTSILQVTAEPDPKPWRVTVSVDNYGFEDNGEFNPTLGLAYDNLLGINDIWDFSYTSAVDQAPFFDRPEPGKSSRQAALGVTVPYGKWAYTLRQSWSGYEGDIQGAISAISTDGNSRTTLLRARRLLHRDEISKTFLGLDLSRAENRNNIARVRIGASSRVISTIGAELSHQRAWKGGQFSGSARLELGIKALGAEDAGAQPPGQPDAQFTRLLLRGDYDKSWALGARGGAIRWISTAEMQYSKDRLYGDQQFRVGNNATVRGSKIALVAGSSGAFWRNEAEYQIAGPKTPGNLTRWLGIPALYVGLDVGRVFDQSRVDITGGSALGGLVGLRTLRGRGSVDLGYAKVVKVSSGLQKPEGHFRFAVNVTF